MNLNPYMMILKADPTRYIQKPAATVLALLKAAEGAAALFALAQFLLSAKNAGFGGSTAILFLSTLPAAVQPPALMIAQAMGEMPFVVAGLCCLMFLVYTALEAVGLLALRFAMAGAGMLKRVQQAAFWNICVLLLTVVVALVLRIYRFATLEFRQDPMLRTIRPVIIFGAAGVIVLVLFAQYHGDVATVFSAIDYEFRLEYKETMVDAPVLGAYSALFSIACLAGAVVLVALLGMEATSPAVIAFAALAVKYFAVNQSWEGFQRCHR